MVALGRVFARVLFVGLCFMPILSCTAENDKNVKGPSGLKIVKQILLSEAHQDLFDGEYEICFLGSAVTETTSFHLYILLKEFGNKRQIKRLIVLSDDLHYLGMYDIPELPSKLDANIVLFQIDKKWGDRIVFEDGTVPSEAYLDGEYYHFFRGDEN